MDKLKKNTILSKEDILSLKKTINEENPYLDNSAKAHILARAIHNSLDKSLKGFTKDYKSIIKTNLIRNTFLNSKESIYQYDVLKACSACEDVSLEFVYQINKWVNKQVNEDIDLSVLKNIIQEINIEAEKDIKDDISLSKVLEDNDENESINEPTQSEISDFNDPIDTEVCINDEKPLDAENLSNIEDEAIQTSQITTEYNCVSRYIITLKNKIVETIRINIPKENIKKYILIYSLAICLLIIPIQHILKNHTKKNEDCLEVVVSTEYDISKLNLEKNDISIVISGELEGMTSHLPDYLKYRQINETGLRNYLVERNSLLSKEPYFSTIIECAKEFNLNPIILFSIAGHEQAFVPNDHDAAKKMVNNPYNVFKSWENYNTNLTDSSKIASRTIINLLKGKPKDEDPFKWINKKYAEDKNWWKGVRKIYYTLEKKSK